MNVVLVGMMASGKSTVGRVLAETLARPFIDTDAEMVQRTGRSIKELFLEDGEDAFRALESTVVEDVAARDGVVIATGGGAILHPANREALRRNGLVFWLEVPLAELVERARGQGLATRPILLESDPVAKLAAVLAVRAPAYAAAAHYRINAGGRDTAAVAAEILAILHAKGDREDAAGARQPR